MIRVPTYVSYSPINGLGVFSAEDIKQGALIWSFEQDLDKRMSIEEFNRLKPEIKNFLEDYSYVSVLDNLVYIPFDNDRYMNHSFSPNTVFAKDGNFYANCDIAKEEEITCDYRQFNVNWDKYAYIFQGSILEKCA